MKIFFIAGEPSGDALGGALMQGLRQLCPEVEFRGVGGDAMQAQGMTSRFDMAELSLLGLVEILPKYFHLKRRIRETAEAIVAWQPDAVITIDAPDFSLRVARQVKAASDIRCVHYVAPTVWAWRPGRAQKMAEVIDHVLALFPFEPPYMEAAGMACDFVGHPIATAPLASAEEAAAFRTEIAPDAQPLLLALPGSRRSEIARHTPIFTDSLARIGKAHPGLRVVLPAAAPVADQVRAAVSDWPVPPVIIDARDVGAEARKRAAFRAADVALAASGTVSLELAAAQTPMVIMGDLNWLSREIIQRMMLVDTFTLVNLVSDTRVIPEFIGRNCKADLIAPAVSEVLADPTAQEQAMALTMERLGKGGEAPGLRAARAVLSRL
ncbi:lipid-A-disaccharide synthase [Aliishimia ponticola]|uniref:Lipid-A-disaccharide synthase n=1 Tax=Aliishimia ponticola TaxID=2499833 RepID=A0A4V3XKV2_9RHOB|nr:lipid-A-disaccharide synthase [Aliishimia ponticola]THH38393.1 lipid-A-disaccharide synthase [Aliishimia ponticola]